MPAKRKLRSAKKPVVQGPIVVPKPCPKKFYGQGIPGVEFERLTGKLIVVCVHTFCAN